MRDGTKPSSPIIEADSGQFHVSQYLENTVLRAVDFHLPENVTATDEARTSLQALGVKSDIVMDSSAKADRLKKLPASAVLQMAYFFGNVVRNPANYQHETRETMRKWSASLVGKAKDVMQEVTTLMEELNNSQHNEHAVIRPEGTPRMHHFSELQPWYLVVSVIARIVGYRRKRQSRYRHSPLREVVMRPFVWLGFWIALVSECLLVVGSFNGTPSRLRERFDANRRNYKDWIDGNRMAYGGMTQWLSNYMGGCHITSISYPSSRFLPLAQGVLLLGCVVVQSYFDNSESIVVLYDDASTRYFMVGPDAEVSATKLSGVKYDPAGGRISSSAFSLVVVWAYIITVLVISLLVCVRNWAKRDAVLERISDAVWVATTGLVSVFGLVKLTSEDPNAIRHALSGRKVLTSSRDIFLHLDPPHLPSSIGWEEYLKVCAASLGNPTEWAKDEQTCYLIDQVDGNIRIADGIHGRSLAIALIFTNGASYFRCSVRDRPYKVECSEGNVFHLTGDRVDERPNEIKSAIRLRGRA